MQKFNKPPKSGGKMIFAKILQMTMCIPCGSKISSKWLYLAPFLRQMHFCILHRNSIWPSKMAGKLFLAKSCRELYTHPVGQKFHQNRSISHHLRDTNVLNIFHHCKIQKIAITHLAVEVYLYNRYHLVGTEKVAEQHIFAKCSKCIRNE